MSYDIELRFNGRTGGAQAWSGTYEAESIGNALELALSDLERNIRKYGGSICVTGVTVEQRP
jgi:hypothetical protein